MCQALGFEKTKCIICRTDDSRLKEFLDEIWSYLLKRDAKLSEEQRKLIHQWDSGVLTSMKLTELLLKLDRTDTLVAQSVATGETNSKTSYYMDGQPIPSSQDVSGSAPRRDFMESEGSQATVSGLALPSSLSSFMQADGDQPMAQQADAEEQVDSDDEDDYDMSMFDDDGYPIVDTAGDTLVPFDPEKTYEEDDAFFLCAFAGTYREVRGQLQATRVGREQKVVKPKFNSFAKKRNLSSNLAQRRNASSQTRNTLQGQG